MSLTNDSRSTIRRALTHVLDERVREGGGDEADSIAILATAMIEAHVAVCIVHGVDAETALDRMMEIVGRNFAECYARCAAEAGPSLH